MIILPDLGDGSQSRPLTQVNPSAAGAPGRAMAAMGGAVADLGDVAGRISADVQAADDSAHLSAAARHLAEAEAQFRLSLTDDHDFDQYGPRLENEVIAPAYDLISPDMSPDARTQLEQTITDWASDARIRTAQEAQNRRVTRAKDELLRSREAWIENGQVDPYLEHLKTQTWLTPEERQREAENARRMHQHRQAEIQIQSDPAAFLENPELTGNPAHDRARMDLARRELHRQTTIAADEALDLIHSNKLGTPEEIDAAFADLRPTARAKLKDALARYQAGLADEARREPAAMHRVAGEVSGMLRAYDPLDVDPQTGLDMQYVQIAGRIRELPPSDLKNHLNERLDAIRKNAQTQVKDGEKAGFDAIDTSFEDGAWGDWKSGQNTIAAVDAGLLTDPVKLAAAGLSDDHIDELADEDLSRSARMRLFRQLWQQRDPAADQLDDYTRAGFMAVVDNRSSFEVIDEDAKREALEAKGQAMDQFARWVETYPELAKDETKVQAKIRELGATAKVKTYKTSFLRPNEPAMLAMARYTEKDQLRPEGSASFEVRAETRDAIANFKSKPGQRYISLDFNDAPNKSARGIEIKVPTDATPAEKAAATAWATETQRWFQSKGVNVPIRHTTGLKTGGRGVSGVFHTEPFFAADSAARKAIQSDPAGYAAILSRTLGRIPGVTFIPPHKSDDPGAMSAGIGERDFASQLLIPELQKLRYRPTVSDDSPALDVLDPASTFRR